MEIVSTNSLENEAESTRTTTVDGILLFCLAFSLIGAIVCGLLWNPFRKDIDNAVACDTSGGPWSAMNRNNYEIWDFVMKGADNIAASMLSQTFHSMDFHRRVGSAVLEYAQAGPDVGEDAPTNTKKHPRPVYLEMPPVKAGLTGKRPLSLKFSTCFYGMKKLTLQPIQRDCTGTVALVASRLYGVGLGHAPVRLFNNNHYLGVYNVVESPTDKSFFDRNGDSSYGMTRIWEGRNASLEYVGDDPELYRNGCRTKECPFCSKVNNVSGVLTCDREARPRITRMSCPCKAKQEAQRGPR
jgi:hypothetical protein